jgi:hypothetical protein
LACVGDGGTSANCFDAAAEAATDITKAAASGANLLLTHVMNLRLAFLALMLRQPRSSPGSSRGRVIAAVEGYVVAATGQEPRDLILWRVKPGSF